MITRQDISSGYQAVQSIHAAIQFNFEHPEVSQEWFKTSNYLGLLSVADETALKLLADEAQQHGIRYSIFKEPDIGDQITAIALEPGMRSKKLCSKLQLALKDK